VNLIDELDKVTQPPFKKSDPRRLSSEEIEQLQAAGQITHVSSIPEYHMCSREVAPIRWGRGRYYGYRG